MTATTRAGVDAGVLAPPPRANPLLLGQESALRQVDHWLATGRLPQALMICGPWGVGKATLAFRIARMLLRRRDPEQPGLLDPAPEMPAEGSGGDALPIDEGSRWVGAGTHPDLLTIERRFDERKGRAASEIVVDDVRRITTFLASSPAVGGWRIVVIDAADEMNRNAANALLKVLEEPGSNSLLMLVCHRPSLLPATVRSRCRKLLLAPLEEQVLNALVERYLPEATPAHAALLCALADGSIGRVLHLAQHDGVAAFRAIGDFFDGLVQGGSGGSSGAWIADPTFGADEDAFRVVVHMLDWWMRRICAGGLAVDPDQGVTAGAQAANALAEATVRPLSAAAPLDRWLKVWDKTQHLLAQAAHGNLDRRQALVTALASIQGELLASTP